MSVVRSLSRVGYEAEFRRKTNLVYSKSHRTLLVARYVVKYGKFAVNYELQAEVQYAVNVNPFLNFLPPPKKKTCFMFLS